ncbi:hypothetical protein [Asticcacaulis taihuensis]|jgi:hypothetical protein|uniref:Uncharacterized protein n=1 Tax=Asticcacaulis taihuensis TaxID=260084 RepID=A0A1G4TB77_9CAUL|nr:hypothetical protein [Asticcacaulis taihuensis]SCW77995.1 hypothetical protein SAMN02927928_3337 [Asticcacaulis taihuensis]
MAKGQKKSTKEIRKPKKAVVKIETVSAGFNKDQRNTLDNIKKS